MSQKINASMCLIYSLKNKITQEEADNIRLLFFVWNCSAKTLIEIFNVSYSTINRILNNKIWRV